MVEKSLDTKWSGFLNTRQPDHLNTGHMDAILFSYVLVQSSTYEKAHKLTV